MAKITAEQALARIQPTRVKATKGKAADVKPLELIDTISNAEDDLFIFGNENGGIIAPADDSLSPILGAWEGNVDDIPPGLKDMLQEYSKEIEWWQNVGEEISEETTADGEERQSVPVLLETKWSQKAPYNGKIYANCVTGCNTIAAAQIMYYWGKKGFHRGCPQTEKYVTETNNWTIYSLPAVTVFDYKHLVKSPKTTEEKEAVQQMVNYIARLFKSDFTPNNTGAYPRQVANYLSKDLKLGKNITYIYASKVGNDGYDALIYNELINGRPVLIAGWTGTGGGHTFIIDGYDADKDMYHVNWGWGGNYDGYFKISALNPHSAKAYNSNKTATIGIQPDYKLGDVSGDGEVNIVDVTLTVNHVLKNQYNEAADINHDGKVTISDAQLIVDAILGKIDL